MALIASVEVASCKISSVGMDLSDGELLIKRVQAQACFKTDVMVAAFLLELLPLVRVSVSDVTANERPAVRAHT